MRIFSVILVLALVLCSSCNEINPREEDQIKAFVIKWNENHTTIRATYLKQQYMDVVEYYDTERTKEIVATDKKLLFEDFPDYRQTLVGDQIEIVEEEGNFLATFENKVSYKDVNTTYSCYLAVIYKNGEFKILREGVIGAEDLEAPIFPKERIRNAQISKNPRLYGDFNGDGLSDYASVESPVIISKDSNNGLSKNRVICKGGCNSVIRFSNPELESVLVEDVYQSQLENLKDLNGDGADEIGFWDLKPNTERLFIFDVKNSRLVTPPLEINTEVHKNLKLIDVIKKSGPGKIRVTESVDVDGQWKLVSRLVEVE
ncbi:hypothetical protein [Sediminibacter sp. Hel_I_10]|uniref:hypothetical protein n=1 Tax=Sediminibacter sp. Hel_I_10 TaxID=1392490 RepID=UPI000479BC3F|nr:hypothetical protein [Sediminibacter sp. Hel_I_10]